MLNPHGYATILDPDAQTPVRELDTVQCGHCGKVIFVKPGTAATVYLITHRDRRVTEEAGAGCRMCMKPVCLSCERDGRCTPLEARLAAMEGRR